MSLSGDGSKDLGFTMDGRSTDVDIAFGPFNAVGKASASSIIVTAGTQEAANPGSQATLSTRSDLLCADCAFLSWGVWDTHLNYGPHGPSNTNTFASGWWIAGETTTIGDLDKLATLGATAQYEGTAWATVDTGAKVYDASGKLWMDWTFASRTGTLKINDFDTTGPLGPVNVTGTMNAPGVLNSYSSNRFDGSLAGSGLTGSAAGSFVNNGNIAAGGIMGNWNIRNDANNATNYRATGIFGGGGTPKLP